jgi:serine/threonine protein kinase
LGSGAQGTVKKIIHKETKNEYAMKIISIDNDMVKPKVVISEFKALYECSHQNVIQLFDAFYKNEQLYLIIEFMNCGSLADVIKECGAIPETVLSVIKKIILENY